MKNLIIIAILVVIVGFAAYYIYKSKKRGKKCIGCPYGCSCEAKNNSNSCNCKN